MLWKCILPYRHIIPLEFKRFLKSSKHLCNAFGGHVCSVIFSQVEVSSLDSFSLCLLTPEHKRSGEIPHGVRAIPLESHGIDPQTYLNLPSSAFHSKTQN